MDAEIKIKVRQNGDVAIEGCSCSIADTIKAIDALIKLVEQLRLYQKKEDEK